MNDAAQMPESHPAQPVPDAFKNETMPVALKAKIALESLGITIAAWGPPAPTYSALVETPLAVALKIATDVLDSRHKDLIRRASDLARDRHDAPAEVREAIEEQRHRTQYEINSINYALSIIRSDSAQRIVAKRGGFCEWRENEDGFWDTGCKRMWATIEGTPAENSMRYCPMCGGTINEVAYIHDDEDDDE